MSSGPMSMRLAKITASGMARPEGLWTSLTAIVASPCLHLFVDELELVVLAVGQGDRHGGEQQRRRWRPHAGSCVACCQSPVVVNHAPASTANACAGRGVSRGRDHAGGRGSDARRSEKWWDQGAGGDLRRLEVERTR